MMERLEDAEASGRGGYAGVSGPAARVGALPAAAAPFGDRARRSLGAAANRGLDIALAVIALAFTLPLTAVISLLIVLDDPGPVLARQRGVRFDGRPFDLLRFRTRLTGRPASFSRVGAVLRRTGLEDLPMLLNLAAGHTPVIGRYSWRQFLAWLDSGAA